MARPKQFRTKRAYDARMKDKANKNLEVMAVVGDGGGTVNVANRDSFYWVRLVDDDDRLTQCFCDTCALSDGDLIYVARAKDEKLSYYEFTRFIQDTDGETTTPPVCPKFAQVIYVSENSCQFNTVGAAVTYIGGLTTGPAANRLFLIKVQAGNFAEGDVTIPKWVHLEGVGEASELEMGANRLLLSDDTSILNIVVESSNASYAIGVVAKDNVILRNVHCIQTGAGTPDCFHVSAGSTNIHLYDCVAEIPANGVGFHVIGASSATTLHTCTTLASAKDTTTYGFQVGDTATVLMDYCTADDATHFNDALHLDDTALTCTTRWCTFQGYDNDVNMAGTTIVAWYHLDCHFDPDNSTLAAAKHIALPTKRFNQTVIVAEHGGDFQALSEALAYINGQDKADDKLFGVLMLHGNFAETEDVTIYQYVHVFGMGEGTEIEMGSKTLTLASDSSLQNVVVEGSDTTTHVVQVHNATGVVLRNVKAIQSDAGYCFYLRGASTAELYHCIAETTAGNARGFQISDGATATLWDCEADDSTNFDYGLATNNAVAGQTVTTLDCRFAGATADVLCDTNSTWTSYKDQVDPMNIIINGTVAMEDLNAGDSFAFVAKNTSGGAAAAGDLGYIDDNGEYQTTATAYLDAAWCVVVVPGPNNSDIWVARRGRITVTLNGNCAVGDYLYTSTTAGQAQPLSYSRPELFAVALTANAAGAGGTCSALLLCHRKTLPYSSINYIIRLNAGAGDSDWQTTIAGLPGGAVVTYTAPLAAGAENTIDVTAAALLGKFVLHNTTRGDSALISTVNIGAPKQITLTAAVPGGWIVGDSIEVRSQTNVQAFGAARFFDVDVSGTFDDTTVALLVNFYFRDSAAANILAGLHTYEAYSASKFIGGRNPAVNIPIYRNIQIGLFNGQFTYIWNANGANTAFPELTIEGIVKATP
jgi:hypothetical protein